MTRKGLNINISFTNDFVELWERLQVSYPDEVFKIQGLHNDDFDINKFSKNFFKKSSVASVSIDGNANVKDRSIIQYIHEVPKAMAKLNGMYLIYKWVKKYFGKKEAETAVEQILNGQIFVSDLTNFSSPYCFSFDLTQLIENGMNFCSNQMYIGPPKRSDSFIDLTIQSTAFISNQIAGAVAYPNFFAILDWFYRKELGEHYTKRLIIGKHFSRCSESFMSDVINKDLVAWGKVKQQFQNLIYSLNFPFRSGSQSSFTNLSVLDKGFCERLMGDTVMPDGTKFNIDSTVELSKLFFEYFSDINSTENVFTFPVMTIAISLDDNGDYIDPNFKQWAAEVNSKKSLSNIYIGEPTSFSSCCRLKNDFSKLADLGFQNSFGVGGVSIGSHRVCGLNLPRLALLSAKDENVVYNTLQTCKHILYAHRKLIQERVENGDLPLYTTNWMSLNRQYSTIGFVGGYEYVENLGLDIKTQFGSDVLAGILKMIESDLIQWEAEYRDEGLIANIEQIPAESMAVRLAVLDDLLGYNPKKHKLYSNQYLPLIENTSIYDRFRLQGKFDTLTSGGAILHLNVDDEKPLTSYEYNTLIDLAKETGTKYFAVNYCYSECSNRHFTVGKHEICPICKNKIIAQYTRPVGFITRVSDWTPVRRDYEFDKRIFYNNKDINHAYC